MHRGGVHMVESVGLPKPKLKRPTRRRRGGPSPAAVGLTILALSLGGLVFQVAHASGERPAPRGSGAVGKIGAHEREAAAFFDDARQALSHLLASAPQLTTFLAEVDSGSQPTA